MTASPILEIRGLAISYRQGGDWRCVLRDVDLSIAPGEVVGLAGESGCGKSTLASLMLGESMPSRRIDGGQILFDGEDLFGLPPGRLRRLRATRIGFVPQNGGAALTPSRRIGKLFKDLFDAGSGLRALAAASACRLLDDVGLPEPEAALGRYPHQFSGGQQQRIALALALAPAPDLLILDEPTTGQDAITRLGLVRLLVRLAASRRMAMLIVSHDLATLGEICDRLLVMYAGDVVEVGAAASVLASPHHPYTRGLIEALPRLDMPPPREAKPVPPIDRAIQPPGCLFAWRCAFSQHACFRTRPAETRIGQDHKVACCRVEDVARAYALTPKSGLAGMSAPAIAQSRHAATSTRGAALLAIESLTCRHGAPPAFRGLPDKRTIAVDSLSFAIAAGETMALVGESGSGKTTLARAVAGLHPVAGGSILYRGERLSGPAERRPLQVRREIQLVFQDPIASLNGKHRIDALLQRPLELFFRLPRPARQRRAAELLAAVQLPEAYLDRFPGELSGGECQRVALARALAAEPALLLCDEITSALDVSTQASVLALIRVLQQQQALALLLISHDLAVVRWAATRVAVLYRGRLCEIAPTGALFEAPAHPYTALLIEAAPRLGAVRENLPAPERGGGGGDISPKGCAFADRCAFAEPRLCRAVPPPWRPVADGHWVACHFDLAPQLSRPGEAAGAQAAPFL